MRGERPAFSVVMPAWNTAWAVASAIRSVLAQTRPDFELIVVDDGSTDGTADVVRRFLDDERVRLVVRETSGGAAAARNTAIAAARAPYVSMLDSDDLWLPRYLETVGRALDENPEAGLACTGHWKLDQLPGLVRREPRAGVPVGVLDARSFLLGLAHRNFVVNSTVTVRRAALARVGGCDVRLPAAIDFDLWLRLAAAGHGAVVIPEALAVYRVHPGSIQNDPRNEFRSWAARRRVLWALAEEWDVEEEVRLVARAAVDEADRQLARLVDRSRRAELARRLRVRARTAKRRLLRRRLWYASPPGELAEASHLLFAEGAPCSS